MLVIILFDHHIVRSTYIMNDDGSDFIACDTSFAIID